MTNFEGGPKRVKKITWKEKIAAGLVAIVGVSGSPDTSKIDLEPGGAKVSRKEEEGGGLTAESEQKEVQKDLENPREKISE